MRPSGIKLHPHTTEAIARRVVELLRRERAHASPELVDASELARRLGVDRSWIYAHAVELGAVKLGGGARPRLRFDPNLAVEQIHMRGHGQDRPESKPTPRRRGRKPSGPTNGRALLPINRGGES